MNSHRATYLAAMLAILATLATAALGCSHASGPGSAPAQPTHSIASPVRRAVPAVELLSWDETQKRREAMRGKVVVLDIWSTYCGPCVREFPNLVALQSRFGDKVQCISFDTDYAGGKEQRPESLRGKVLDFLTSKNAMLVNVISTDADEALYDRLGIGGPPVVYVYGQSGKLVKRFDNSVPKAPEFTYKTHVVPLVEKLLAEPQ